LREHGIDRSCLVRMRNIAMATSIVQLHGLDTGSGNFALGYTAGLAAGSAATTPVPQRKRAAEVLPWNLPPVGGLLEQAAALIGVSPNTYLEMERQGIMPGPVRFGRRCLYDFEAVRAAFKRLQCTSTTNGTAPVLRANADHTWEDIDNA
jgi:hypothetical protein